MMYCWCEGLALLLRLNPWLKWDVQGLGLNKKNWYLLISNHHSWADIVVLCVLFRKHIPMNKYFLKQQLAWVPFIGLACWALDMPFMRRYSQVIYSAIQSAAAKMLKPLAAPAKIPRASNNDC
jgi:1-acyl-sn-glycerol-3-phosphate acyltransferase